ncbi:MAG TPA: hypothetical protein VHY22_01620 [Chthoniobacteraceae bacterium]|nr:hypothetical protein [Chthoniobacteraceae bacterium]
MRLFVRTALFFLIVFNGCLRAAEYQWSVPMEPTTPEAGKHPRAFLWIPPGCRRVRAVVLGQQGMLEQGLFDSPIFRQTMSDLDFAIVWVSPGFDPVFRFDHGAGDRVEAMLKALADVSGYGELAYAPVAPIGDSKSGAFPWNFAAWNPGRTLAALSIHGGVGGRSAPDLGKQKVDGIPGLIVAYAGEWLFMGSGMDGVTAFHQKYPNLPLDVLFDDETDALECPDRLISYLALFLRKAAFARLPDDVPVDGPETLKAVDPRRGWLINQWNIQKTPPAPFADFAGSRDQAWWCFDGEMAWAAEHFQIPDNRKPEYLGFEQDGAPAKETEVNEILKFEPLPDGITFRVKAAFLDSVPAGHPLTHMQVPAGSHLDHATGGGPVTVSRIAGPVIETGAGTWAVHFDRACDATDYEKLTDQIWLLAKQNGDNEYRSAVERASMTIPAHNLQGSDQHITFPPIPSQTNATGSLKLAASSDSGLPVSYYVREGPAEIEGNTLRFTAVPPRAKYPIKVTVVAWQYGSPTSPRVKSAEPVTQVITITR